jgi:huntingtin
MVCLSDLFMEREQFEFMLDTLLDVVKAHPSEDELVNQYLTVGLAKSTAVVGVVCSSGTFCACHFVKKFSMWT